MTLDRTILDSLLQDYQKAWISGMFPDEIPEIKRPGDPGWAEHRFELLRGTAERLSFKGWKFFKKEGPRGICYIGLGPRGNRIQSEQDPDERAALMKALDHAGSLH
ncbi:MAG: hypothetical protein ABIS50_15230 [Luteolibacter sp.]|uniref:hypothetical protein n=1 Tax=Luteolibacter sp. TaxID=1962973 RepID=UPI0032678E66